MTPSNELQRIIFERLTAAGYVVVDPPDKDTPYPYISFGPSDVVEDDADCITARVETVQIDVWSDAQDGQREAKGVVDACRRLLHGYEAEMGVHALVEMRVAVTRMLRDPSDLWHGVVTVEAIVEEG